MYVFAIERQLYIELATYLIELANIVIVPKFKSLGSFIRICVDREVIVMREAMELLKICMLVPLLSNVIYLKHFAVICIVCHYLLTPKYQRRVKHSRCRRPVDAYTRAGNSLVYPSRRLNTSTSLMHCSF